MSNSVGENQPAAGKTRRSDFETDRCWMSMVTEEPVSHDLKQLVRDDLVNAWQFQREAKHRENAKFEWSTSDASRLVLKDVVGRVDKWKSLWLYNKLTAFYCLQSAHWGEDLPTRIIMACVWDEWRRCHDSAPNIEYGRFFANLVRITPTGPTTVREVIRAHLSLCSQASRLVEQANQRVESTSSGSEIRPYSILPLYRSIIVIQDSTDGWGAPKVEDRDGKLSVALFARLQTVLIARTGVEEGLSEAISFEGLESESLPLDTAEDITRNVQVVRVSLAAAVQFICGLEARENSAFPKPEGPLALDRSLGPYASFENEPCLNPEVWADTVIAAAEKHGYDNIEEAWQSIRRVKADLVGEGFMELEHEPLRHRWKP